MASERSSAGDPARTLALLWGVSTEEKPGRRGPRQAKSPAEIAAVAIALADADGVDAVTMRRVAQELGVSPMALYTYVPGKAELLDLMLDTVYATMPRSAPPTRAGGPGSPRSRTTTARSTAPTPGWRASRPAVRRWGRG